MLSSWWKPSAGAAAILVVCLLAIGPAFRPSHSGEVADTAPRVRKTPRIPDNRRAADLADRLSAALGSGSAGEKERAFKELLPDFLDRDITAAARLAENLQPWASREEVLFEVAQAWAAIDPAAAAGWARELPDTSESVAVCNHVCIAIAKTDPLRALELAGNDDALQRQLLQLLAAKDLEAALRWAGKQTDADFRPAAFARVALGHAETSPEDAARLVAAHLSPGPLQDQTALAVLHQWILRDPASARRWVDIFPDGPLLRIAESELAAAAAYQAAD